MLVAIKNFTHFPKLNKEWREKQANVVPIQWQSVAMLEHLPIIERLVTFIASVVAVKN